MAIEGTVVVFYIVVGFMLIFMILIQSTVLSIFFPMITPVDHFAVPNLAIIVLIFVCLIRPERNVILIAFLIGLMKDIIFGSYIGLYAFTYAFIAYWANITFRLFIDKNIVVFVISVILALVSFEFLVWGINSLFGLIELSFVQSFDRYFWGSVLLGSAIAAIFYQPVISLLERRGVVFYE